MLNRVMIVAGEPSGDVHGSGVVRELKQRVPGIDVFGVGGDAMRSEGMDVVFDISKLSFMGFIEVARNLSVVKELSTTLEALLDRRTPDVVVLIDYPGFNIRFARKAKRHGRKVLYYISPQVWAWRKGRVKTMRSCVDRMKVVFPFEVDFYRKEGIDVEFVGHPLAEHLRVSSTREEFCRSHNLQPDKKLVALLPGSRKQEIENIFPVMLAAARKLQQEMKVQVVVGVAPSLEANFLRSFADATDQIVFVHNATYDVMAHADAAIVTSGTATLETGWFGTPMTVVYKTSPVTYFIGRMLVDMPYIGLVNVVANDLQPRAKVVPEFVQHDMKVENLVAETKRQLTDSEYAARMRAQLAVIKMKLGLPGASANVARGILELGSV